EPQPFDGTLPLQNYQAIRRELETFDPQLALRPEILVVTKADLPGADQVRCQLADQLGRDVLLISAATGQGLNQLVTAILQTLDQQKTVGTRG
ncbi:MAG TPA: GTPase ObgE, partial [Thermoguttaceae bacterium]|nr:GTPase ObgE [Thermoguttaceae bacterium]